MRLPSGRRRLLLLAGLLLFAWTARQLATTGGGDGESTIAKAFRDRRSGLVVEAAGTVERLLADDREGSAHQRLIVRLAGGQTVLVSHNIDLAPRVPAAPGDRLSFRGQYEWNDRGGVVHWTHHDPAGRRPGGWLRHGGRTYR
jgi:hypothetical protein